MHSFSAPIPDRTPGHQTVTKVLRKLTAGHALYFPGEQKPPTVAGVSVMPRRHSDVARATLHFDGSMTAVYVKLHKRPKRRPDTPLETVLEHARREYDILSAHYEKFRRIPGYSVPRPVAFFPEEIAVVTEEVKGDNLHHLIKKKARLWQGDSEIDTLKTHCRECGVWLSHFQALTSEQRRAKLPVGDIQEQLRTDLETCVKMGLPRADAMRLFRFCQARLRKLEAREFPVVGEHPDFQPDNVVLSRAGVTVLDFTNFRYGSACNDVARFLVSLDFLSKNPFYGPRTIHALMAAFLEGYGWKRGEMDAGVLVYLIRHMALAVATVSTWTYPPLVKRFWQRRAAAFLSAWSRNLIEAADDFVERIVRSG